MARTKGVGILQELGGCFLEVATWSNARGTQEHARSQRSAGHRPWRLQKAAPLLSCGGKAVRDQG